jgi:hypothetical protein
MLSTIRQLSPTRLNGCRCVCHAHHRVHTSIVSGTEAARRNMGATAMGATAMGATDIGATAVFVIYLVESPVYYGK